MLTLPTLEPHYVCPGETHAISRAVHLSRLAAFYPKCRECSHRQETGQLPHLQFEADDVEGPRESERSLLTLEGVRGVHLNELTRHKAGELAAAFASLIWETLPLAGRSDLRDANSKRPIRRSGPVVVVGFDERPASPDIVSGVAAALRRMSCQVIDIGQTSVPCFRFAVAHMHAAGGILISGHGCNPSWTGLDFAIKHGRPVSVGGRQVERHADNNGSPVLSLEDIQQRCEQGVARPLRQGGSQRVFQVAVPYVAGLLQRFHALRPLRVTMGCPVRFVRRTLERLFENLPVMLDWIEIPQRKRDLSDANDADVRRVCDRVVETSADFGFLIDDDGANVAVLDEVGAVLTPGDLLCVLADGLLAEKLGGAVVIDSAAREHMQPRIASKEGRCWLGGWTQSDVWQTMRHESAICGGGATGRIWLRDAVPACDAILTLAQLLQTLSRDDLPLSHVVAESCTAA